MKPTRIASTRKVTIVPTRDGFAVRIRCGRSKGGQAQNPRFTIKTKDASQAQSRADDMAELASKMVAAGISAGAPMTLKKAANADAEMLRLISADVERRCASCRKATPAQTTEVTFRELGERWTSGELSERYPDHVKVKRTADKDRGLLERLYATIGPVPLSTFTLEDAERAMAAVPKGRRPATRRHYAQLIAKVLAMAVYPLRIIERSPLPRGFLPRIGQRPAFAYLYPAEDTQLLGCRDVPLPHRMLYGVLAREGLRISEALELRWHHVDLKHGTVRLDRSKTGDARAWALDPGVTAALAAFRGDAPLDALVFAGVPLKKAAATFREHLLMAQVKRSELHERTAERSPLRVHDLRATFCTLSLANGKTETWVQDRTGHTTSLMLNKYRRQARHAAELGLGPLAPLHVAVRDFAGPSAKPEPQGEPGPGGGEPVERELSNDSSSSPCRGRTGTPVTARDFKTGREAPTDTETAENMPPQDAQARRSMADGSPESPSSEPRKHLKAALTAAVEAGDWALVRQLTDLLEGPRPLPPAPPDPNVIDLTTRRGKGKP